MQGLIPFFTKMGKKTRMIKKRGNHSTQIRLEFRKITILAPVPMLNPPPPLPFYSASPFYLRMAIPAAFLDTVTKFPFSGHDSERAMATNSLFLLGLLSWTHDSTHTPAMASFFLSDFSIPTHPPIFIHPQSPRYFLSPVYDDVSQDVTSWVNFYQSQSSIATTKGHSYSLVFEGI